MEPINLKISENNAVQCYRALAESGHWRSEGKHVIEENQKKRNMEFKYGKVKHVDETK